MNERLYAPTNTNPPPIGGALRGLGPRVLR